MSIAITTTKNIRAGGLTISDSVAINAQTLVTLDVAAPTGATTPYEFAYESTKVKYFYLLAAADCDIIINDTADETSPITTFTMKAGREVVWSDGDSGTAPYDTGTNGVFLVVVDAQAGGSTNAIKAVVGVA